MIRLLVIVLLNLFYSPAFGQQRYTVSGTIRDKKTGEALIGVSISVKERPGAGVVSNAYGFYAISLPEGNYTFIVTSAGSNT